MYSYTESQMVTTDDNYAELTALFRAAMRGDSGSYAAFLENIIPILKRIVDKRLTPDETEDIVQEILISIHKARHTYDGKRPIMPWVVAIAKFRIADYLRSHYAHKRNQTDSLEEVEDTLASVTEIAENHESLEVVLQEVPEKQRQILTMMHMEGYTAKEIGKRLGMKESAVKVAAHRAVKKIRERFGT